MLIPDEVGDVAVCGVRSPMLVPSKPAVLTMRMGRFKFFCRRASSLDSCTGISVTISILSWRLGAARDA